MTGPYFQLGNERRTFTASLLYALALGCLLACGCTSGAQGSSNQSGAVSRKIAYLEEIERNPPLAHTRYQAVREAYCRGEHDWANLFAYEHRPPVEILAEYIEILAFFADKGESHAEMSFVGITYRETDGSELSLRAKMLAMGHMSFQNAWKEMRARVRLLIEESEYVVESES